MADTGADRALTAWMQQELGAAPAKELFVRHQTAQVAGYRLTDGRHVVVKMRREPLPRVATCLVVQNALYAAHFPCARPLTKASVVGGLTVHAEEYVDGGELLFGSDEVIAPAFAAGLAMLMTALERSHDVVDPVHLSPPPWIGWWMRKPWGPAPRLPDLVLAAAERVRGFMRGVTLPGVVGHADWESQNIRWVRNHLHVVHDWDSLAWMPEAVFAGAAASTFPSDHQPVLATLRATEIFLDEYQRARERMFSKEERAVFWAAGLLPALFNARNEALENKRTLVLDELPSQCEERLRRAGA